MAPPFLPPAMAHHPHKDQHSRHDREIIFERFKASDKNKDGKLSKEEAPEHLKRHFDAIDADHDGQLTSGELKRSVELLRERHAPEKRQKSDERKKSDKRKK
jgi:Ca2+-binding EF-hand superfamily protein